MTETTTPTSPSMGEARQQQRDKERAIAENARRRQLEQREQRIKSLRSAVERHGLVWPGDTGAVHLKPRPNRPNVAVYIGAYQFGWAAGANRLMLHVVPDVGDRDDGRWVTCSSPSADYPLAWLAETWDRGQDEIAEARRRRAEYEARQRARAEDPDLEPEPTGPEPYTIARESPMGQLITGLVDVISAAGGHGQLW